MKIILTLLFCFICSTGWASTATYYFNAYDVDGEEWGSGPDNMVDGSLDTYSRGFADEVELLTGNTCDGTNLGTITKVELRIYGAMGDYPSDRIELRPVFGGGDGTNHDVGNIYIEWSSYIDITTDTNAPSSWTWTIVQDLDCDVVAIVTIHDNVVAYKVEIRVTYTGGVTVTPDALSLTLTLQAPTIAAERYVTVTPDAIPLTLTLQAPTIVLPARSKLQGATLQNCTIN